MSWSISNYLNKFRNRNFHLSAANMSQDLAKQEPSMDEGAHKVPVRPIDKIMLVWSGKYKSTKEVPDRISPPVLLKCHNVCRVKICNYMIALTLIAAVFYAMSGKRDAQKGLTVSHMNRKWHEEYDKKMDEEEKKA